MISSTAFGQSPDEDNIKQVVQSASKEFLYRNIDQWKANWKQDDKVRLSFTSGSFHAAALGWDSIEKMVRSFPPPSDSNKMSYSAKDFVIRTDGNMASADYTTTIVSPDTDSSGNHWHTFSTFIKEGNDWKFTSQQSTLLNSFDTNNPKAIEDNINNAGYQLMNAHRLNDAIEIFKLNVKFFPKAWNPYDSLGEAYAKAGKKDQAVKNYEMSIKLNPDNENGKKMLEKIKQNKPL
jgi:tetratricopeptide (TPR) repeat protein